MSKTITKCMRYEIIKPTNCSWEEFGKVLNDLRYKSAKIGNYIIQLLWQWDTYRNDYKEKNNVYPDSKEQPNYYKLLRAKFPGVGTTIINQTRQWVANKYQKDRKDIFLHKKSLTSFRDNMPICIYNASYQLTENNNSIEISALLLPNSEPISRFNFIIKAGEKSKKSILSKIACGEYKQGMMQIIKEKDKKWYVLVSYTFTPKTKEQLIENKLMTVIFTEDMQGITLEITNYKNDLIVDCNHISHYINQFDSRIDALKKQERYGVIKKVHNKIATIQEKINNYKLTENHRISKAIVTLALRHKCKFITIKGDKWFIDWTLYDLKTKLQYKAAENSIETIEE